MKRPSFYKEIMPTRAHVYVGDKELSNVSLRLGQAFGEHHKFSIKTDFDALGQDFMHDPSIISN